MNFLALLIFPVAMLAGAGVLAAPPEAAQAAQEGLAAVRSRDLDQVYLRPDVKLAQYRKVMVEPVRVEFDEVWLRDRSRPVGEENIKRIAAGIAADTQATVADVFRARGHEVVAAPGPGVLRLSPRIADLYVNAPDSLSPWRGKTFTKEAGQAVMLLDARDAASNRLVARVVHRGTARQMGRYTWANDTSNQIWFDALVRRWAEKVAAEFEAD